MILITLFRNFQYKINPINHVSADYSADDSPLSEVAYFGAINLKYLNGIAKIC